MAFDISTAKPITAQAGGFDISTARPVQQAQIAPVGPPTAVSQPQQRDPFISDPQSLIPGGQVQAGPPAVKEEQDESLAVTAGRKLQGAGEVATTLITGTAGEILGGLAGIGTALNPFTDLPAAEAVKNVRQLFTRQPVTPEGKAQLAATGEALAPVGKAIKGLEEKVGSDVLEVTGSPFLAAGATALPTALLTALGVRRTPTGTAVISPQRAREIKSVLDASSKTGVDVLTSDIFQPKSIFSRLARQFSERIPVVGTGGKRAAQQEQRVSALEALAEQTPRVEAADIVSSLKNSANKRRVAAGDRINAVTEKMAGLGAVEVKNTIVRIDAALAKLNRPGKIGSPDLVKSLNDLKQTAADAGSDFGVLREFRTDARAIADRVDPTGRSQLRSSDKALMESVIGGITKDLDAFVVKNGDARALSRYKLADQAYAQESSKLTKSRLKTILDKGDVKPELINNLLFSSAPSEVKLLHKSLGKAGRDNAKYALYRRAIDNASKGGTISPERFISELGKMEQNFNIFFRGADNIELTGLRKLLTATKRAAEAGVVAPTGQVIQGSALAGVTGAALLGDAKAIATILTGATAGGIARIYESAGVRNMLIQLGKAPKRSTLEKDLLKALPVVLAEASREIEQEKQAEKTPLEAPIQ